MTTMNLPAPLVEDGLTFYFREIWKFPVLTVDEEYMLAQRWREHGDVEAAHKLVTSHLRLVAKIATKYRGYGLPVSDLMAEGNIGLMKAVKKFEPERGFRLATYAMWWIRAAITEYVLRSWSMVKVGTVAAQKKLFFSLRKLKRRLEITHDGELEATEVRRLARAVDVSERDVVDMNRRLSACDVSLNAPVSRGDGDSGLQFQDTIADEAPSPEVITADGQEMDQRRRLLSRAVECLRERDREIFVERYLSDDPPTLEELGRRYGISRERVRQLESRAFKLVQQAVVEAAEAQPA